MRARAAARITSSISSPSIDFLYYYSSKIFKSIVVALKRWLSEFFCQNLPAYLNSKQSKKRLTKLYKFTLRFVNFFVPSLQSITNGYSGYSIDTIQCIVYTQCITRV